ncbi:MAG: hypothetical protein MR550_01655 [Bacilli bacterium]|nr:hypothetical protein [Bacilli bacterium]
MKKDNIMDYYLGNKAYNLFLQGIIYNNPIYSEGILDKKNINATKIGCISNIFLAIKEDLVSKDKEGYNSRILISELENNVSLIATKENNGYRINNYLFPDAPTLVSVLRNKLAHGLYTMDLEHNRIIFNIESNEVIINIDKLSTYVISCLKSYTKVNNSSIYKRDFVINNKVDTTREKPMKSINELNNFIKNSREIEIILIKKDNTLISNYVVWELENIIDEYRITKNNKLLINFENNYKDEYDFKWNIKKLNDDKTKELSNFILNIIPQNITYNEEVMVILKEYASKINNNYNRFNVIMENLTNLVLLDAIKENNTVNSNILFDKIKEKYNNIYISYNTLISSSIAMFNSLFSYANDDVYKNDNKYTLLDNNGLDYSKLDLSLINVQIKTIDNTIINELNIRKTAKEKELNLIDTKITKELNNLNIVKSKSNTNAINNITNKLTNLYNIKNTLTIEHNNIINELNICNNYYNNNLLYLENESIITGIRNSIAHGNYEVVQCNNINDTYIVFNDIYEGKLTFKGTIKILDFIDLIDNNAIVINEFLNNLDNKKYIKKY